MVLGKLRRRFWAISSSVKKGLNGAQKCAAIEGALHPSNLSVFHLSVFELKITKTIESSTFFRINELCASKLTELVLLRQNGLMALSPESVYNHEWNLLGCNCIV